jgi:hypothetical protein
MEAVFQREKFWIFPVIYECFLAERTGIEPEVNGKKPETFRLKYCFHVSIDFRCFPAGTGPYCLTWVHLL